MIEKSLKCALWNVTSMVHKTEKIMEYVLDRNSDILFISETWLTSELNHITALVKDYGYKLLHRRKNRLKEMGGGVGILVKLNLTCKQTKSETYSSFECTQAKLVLENKKVVTLVCVYRLLFISVVTFLEEFVKLLEVLITSRDSIILAGDVNVHTETDKSYAKQFNDILDMFNMTQHVHIPTHKMGHTLDIVVTYNSNPRVLNVTASEYEDISHHFLVDFTANCIPKTNEHKVVTFRNLKNIDTEKFTADVNNKLHVSDSLGFGENTQHYNEVLSSVLNDHAPKKSRTIKIVPEAPWFDQEYANLRKERRKAEKLYHRTSLATHKENYVNLRKQCTELAHQKKCKFYGDKLGTGDPKLMYSSIHRLLDRNKEIILPDNENDADLANSFMTFFSEKIDKIRSSFHDNNLSTNIIETEQQPLHVNKLSAFKQVTEDEVRKVVVSYGVKCSPEDPFPSILVTQYSDLLLPIWTKLVNLSLAEGSMDCLKNAIIFPLIKDIDNFVDRDNKNNYRPVSNLLFIGKLIERIVSAQLDNHMSANNLHQDFQYGYKQGHSCETLLLKVVNDLLLSCDKQIPTIVMLLDLSAAFDTIDQHKLLQILHDDIGINGTALKWFTSFLIGRTQKVKIGESYSILSFLLYGAPQGSVLAPRLFNIYVRSLKKYVEPSRFSIFGFADDHQLLKTFLPLLQIEAFGGDIKQCFTLITEWMNKYFLKLNAGKTKVLIVAPPAVSGIITVGGSLIDNDCIRFVHSAKNLGVILDDELQFTKQITKVVQSCFCTIRDLSTIKSFLSYDQLRIAISTFVFSKLDYCNSLYNGVHSSLLSKMQSVQNSAARLLRKKNGLGVFSIREVIRKCHWLRIRERIFFKTCLLVHKCLHGTAPNSLSELLTFSSSSRTMLLTQYQHGTKFGNRSFSRMGPKMWNLLSLELRLETNTDKFKCGLKTLLFDDGGKLFEKLC